MEAVLEYITKITQSNLLISIALIVGIFVCLICIAVVDRKIGYVRKELDAIIKHLGIEIPEDAPVKKTRKKDNKETKD
jgi:hypothetical protein